MPPTEQTPKNRFAFLNPANTEGNKFSLSDSSSKHRLIVAGGGAAIIIVLFVLFYALVLAHKPTAKNLITLAQQQTELIQISTTAENQASQQTTKNLAINTSLTLTTGQQQLLSYLKKHSQKISAKQLVQDESTATTEELNNALSADNFDAVYTQVMQSQLSAYLQSLNQSLGTSSNKTETQLLKYELDVATTLQNQATNNSKALAEI